MKSFVNFTPAAQAQFPSDTRGLWDFANYSATPRSVVKNEFAADQTLSADVLQYNGGHFGTLWSKFGTPVATITDVAADGSARITWAAGTGSVAGVNTTVTSGVYTLIYTLAAVSGTPSVTLRNAFNGAATSVITLSTTPTRYRFVTASTTSVSPEILNASGAAADFYIYRIEAYAGNVADPGAGGKNDHLFLGSTAYASDKPPVNTTTGTVDLTGAATSNTGTIQFASPFSNTAFTIQMLVKKTAAGSYSALAVPLALFGFQALFTPDYGGSTGFQIVVSGVNSLVGHTGRGSTSNQPFQGQPFDRYGKNYMVMTMRYDLATLKASAFVDDVQIGGQVNCSAATASTVRDMILNFQQSTETMAILGAIDRAMTDAEVRASVALMRRRAARRGLALDTTRRVVVFEGNSNTDGLVLTAGGNGPYPYLYKANATIPYHGVVYAVGGNNLANLEARKDLVKAVSNTTPGRIFDFCCMIGSNDGPNIQTQDAASYATRYAAYLDYVTGGPKNDGSGQFVNFRKVIIGTIPNRLDGGSVAQPAFDTWRQALNTSIRGWVGTHCTHIVDIGNDPYLGGTNAPNDTNNFVDKVHYTQGTYGTPNTGQALVESLWRVPLNA